MDALIVGTVGTGGWGAVVGASALGLELGYDKIAKPIFDRTIYRIARIEYYYNYLGKYMIGHRK